MSTTATLRLILQATPSSSLQLTGSESAQFLCFQGEGGLEPSGAEHWLVEDEGQPAFDLWLYAVDSGSLFRAGTTELVAQVIQFGLECEDRLLAERLRAAIVDARAKHPDRAIARVSTRLAWDDDDD